MTELLLTPTDWVFVPTPEGTLPDYARNQVIREAETWRLGAERTVDDGMDGDWSYTNKKGKLIKRLGKVWYAQYKEELPPPLVRVAEQMISTYRKEGYFYRIVEKLDWQKGEYADRSSCFWDWNSKYRADATAAGALAIVLREAKDRSTPERGYGRAFLFPHKGNIWLTNNYGPRMETFVEVVDKEVLKDQPHKYVPAQQRIALDIQYNGYHNYGFYDNITSHIFMPEEVEEPDYAPLVFEGCQCAATFNGRSAEGLRVCANCPFTERQRRQGGV